MTTTKTTSVARTAAGPILAIDLGKYKSVACVYRAAARRLWQFRRAVCPRGPTTPGRRPDRPRPTG